MFRTHLAALGLLLCVFLGGQPAVVAEPPPPNGKLDPDDPLFRALESLQKDVAELRSEIEGRPVKVNSAKTIPSPTMTPAATAKPSVPGRQPDVAAPTTTRTTSKTDASATLELAAAERTSDHWSFQPVRRPAIPQVRDSAWPRSDGDRFILAKIEAAGLHPSSDAEAAVFCRRVHLDLLGLPPSPTVVERFVHEVAAARGDRDAEERAYAALVDQLLASPRFGERWARHWLDVVRYADSVGRSWNAPFTYAWRYRDYVIDAFNADVPYDRFIAEQLAGDLLTSDDVEERRAQLTGCGFLGLGSLELRAESNSGFVMDRIDDQIDVTTRAFLGLTIACARCHDHKYDPISMHDYYALAGIFYSTETLPGQAQRHNLGAGGYVDAERLVRLPSRGSARGAASNAGRFGVHSMNDFQQVWSTDRNGARYTTDPDLAMGAREGPVGDCELRIRGEPYDLGPAIPRGELRIPSLPKLPPIPAHVSGRLELARWIGSPQNPLTARVMVNRIWQHLFGGGLVRTVDDFGSTGESPTHPELLDWLADEFVRNGWSMKRLMRSVVLSRTYRLASTGTPEGTQTDPDNRLYWRANLRALEFEPLRDSMLFVADRLETERPYGIQVAGTGGKQGNRSLLSIHEPYRTIYLPTMRGHIPDVYGVFNFPDPTQIQGLRAATTVAPQALFLMNDEFAVDCATSAARGLTSETADDAAAVKSAYLKFYSRSPTAAETQAALAFLADLQPSSATSDARLYRWTALAQALLAGAEFRYVR